MIFKTIFNLISWLFLGLILLVIIFTIGSNTNLFGGYKSFLVLSGSMEPTINIGDIIIVHRQEQYFQNEVVTFSASNARTVTHRIVETNTKDAKPTFTTRGDANRTEDDEQINKEEIVGKVTLVIPKIGFLVNFSKSLTGLITLIFVPTAFLMFDLIYKHLVSKNIK